MPFKSLKKKKKHNIKEEELSNFMQREMQNARLGVLYVFSKTEVDGKFASLFTSSLLSYASSSMSAVGKIEDIKGLSTAGTVTSGAKVGAEQLVKYFEGQSNKGAKPKSSDEKKIQDEAESTFGQMFRDFCQKIWAKLTGDVIVNMGNWGALLKAVIKGIVGLVCSAAIPLGGVFDVVKGTAQACRAGFQRVMSWIETNSVTMVKGVPTIIVGAIQKAMNRSIGEGLYNVLKGGLQIGGDVLTVGGGTLVKVIATGIELLVQVIMRIVEITTFEAFSNEAKQHWQGRKTSGFTKDPDAFAAWFKKFAFKVPAIGAIAMNCGYCGGPMQYLGMYTGKGKTITSKDYLSGVAMLERHKKFAAGYLNDIGLAFKSSDPVVNGALKAAKNYNSKNHIKQNSVGDVVYGVLTG